MPGYQFLDQIIPAPKRLREKFNYAQLAEVNIWNETPDLYELSNELSHYRNKEELILNIKNRCCDRGVRCQMPYGVKNETIYVNCAAWKAPTPGFPSLKPDDGPCGGASRDPKRKKMNCPFSLIYKKQELVQGNTDKKMHPACKDEEAETALSQGSGVGVYYLAKFRGLHNHPLEPCLFDMHAEESWLNDPVRMMKKGELYTQRIFRNPIEKSVLDMLMTQAEADIIEG